MTKTSTPSSWDARAAANFRRARRKLLVQTESWVGVPEPGTKWIAVAGGHITIVDEQDYEFLNQWNWGLNNYGYVTRRVRGVSYSMHREILNTPKDRHTDHINHNKLDNRRLNLRICTIQENQFNRLKARGFTSRFKGVSWSKKERKFMAYIKFNKKSKRIGSFKTEEDAAKAYDCFALRIHGNFALVNGS